MDEQILKQIYQYITENKASKEPSYIENNIAVMFDLTFEDAQSYYSLFKDATDETVSEIVENQIANMRLEDTGRPDQWTGRVRREVKPNDIFGGYTGDKVMGEDGDSMLVEPASRDFKELFDIIS